MFQKNCFGREFLFRENFGAIIDGKWLRPLPEKPPWKHAHYSNPKKERSVLLFLRASAKLRDGFFVSRVPLLPPSPPSAAASGHSTLIGPRLPNLQNGGERRGGKRLSSSSLFSCLNWRAVPTKTKPPPPTSPPPPGKECH